MVSSSRVYWGSVFSDALKFVTFFVAVALNAILRTRYFGSCSPMQLGSMFDDHGRCYPSREHTTHAKVDPYYIRCRLSPVVYPHHGYSFFSSLSTTIPRSCQLWSPVFSSKNLQRCGHCQEVLYCGTDHQKQHWKEGGGGHKVICSYVENHPECLFIRVTV